MNFTELEREIIAGPQSRRIEIQAELQSNISKLDYVMSRFMEDFGSKIDELKDDNYNAFYSDTTNEYNKINRLLRILNAYSNTATHNLHPGYA